jgi:hypothetical protein
MPATCAEKSAGGADADRRVATPGWGPISKLVPARFVDPLSGGLERQDVYPTAENSSASSDSSCFSVRLSCEWIWQTRLSDTPRMSPISRRVRFLT